MPAYTACGATLYDITDATPGTEVKGMSSIQWGESANVGDYADNTTGCSLDPLVGPVTRSGSVTINLQDSERGKLPYRATQKKKFRILVGGAPTDYWDMDVLILDMTDHVYDLGSTDPVQVTYAFRIYGQPTPNGSVAGGSSS